MCDNAKVVDSDGDSDSDEGILAGYSLPTFLGSDETSTIMQQSSLTRSQYASVVFHGVSDTYPPDGDIAFKYSLTDGVEPSPGDRIVVFAVGWSSIKDYIVFDWAPMPKEGKRNSSVIFKAKDLPKDNNEFYQVCYVSNEGSVFGASVPFQIRMNNDELTFAIEEDMVVVRSSNDLAKEKLLKAQVDRENLNREKTDLEKQLKVLEEKYETTLRELKRLEEVSNETNSYNEELRIENTRYRETESEIIELRKELEKSKILIESMEFDKNKIDDEVKSLNNFNKHCKLMINNLKISEKESEDRLIEAIERIETMRKSQEKLKNELTLSSRESKEIDVIRMRNFSLENELTVCKFNLNNSQLENLRLKSESDVILKDNNILNDKLRDLMDTEEIRRNYFDERCSSNGDFDKGKLIKDNTKLIKTSEELQYRISALEQDKLTIEQILEETLEAQNKNCRDNFLVKRKKEEEKIISDSLSSSSSSSKINENDNYLLTERLREQSFMLIKKDKEIDDAKVIIDRMKMEFDNMKIELNQEMKNLLSKNDNLVREERNLQELRNEMQRITFMNEELLTENSGLMERLRKMELNKLSFREDIKESSLELENENLRKQLDTAYKNFDKTWKERGDSLTLPKFSENGEGTSCSVSTNDEKINDSSIVYEITDERIDEMIKKGLEKLNIKFFINENDEKKRELRSSSSSSSSSSFEPKLLDIFEKVDKVFSVLKKLSDDKENDIKNSSSSSSSSSVVSKNYHHDVEELKERLSRARYEYEKLQGVTIAYKKKYKDLKIKYKSIR